jgi:hypothetical protein
MVCSGVIVHFSDTVLFGNCADSVGMLRRKWERGEGFFMSKEDDVNT